MLWSLSARAGLRLVARPLEHWDKRAASTANRYLTNSTATAAAILETYGIVAEVLPPPPWLVRGGAEQPVEGVEPGFWLCVARLLPYKNVDAVVEAVVRSPDHRLVVVGDGPGRAHIEAMAGDRVLVLGAIDDAQLRWLYDNCCGLVSASYEDYGLTPLEAASFGRPSAVLRWGGFRDTVIEGRTGVFFDSPDPDDIGAAMDRLVDLNLGRPDLEQHAAKFDRCRFVQRLRQVVDEELEMAKTAQT